MEPIEIEPEFVLLCTTDFVNLRASPGKPPRGEPDNKLETLPPRIQMTSTGNEAQATADGTMYTWYEVETVGGKRGWIAKNSNWLEEGECSQVVALAAGMRIIDSPSTLGGNLWDAEDYHYGVDMHSTLGNLNLYSPLDGTVAASDSCPACLVVDPVNGQNLGDRRAEYNYGYGATVITEYPYADMSQEQIEGLAAAEITVEPGQSLYLMTAHLNPNRDIPGPGSDLTAGDAVATTGTSGDSSGVHGHIEAAVSDSGLRLNEGQPISNY